MFNFRLQRILELREKAEQAKARDLATAQDAADAARRERDALADLHASSRAEVDAAHRTEPRVGHLQQLGLVLNALDQRLESAGETMRAANDVVDGAQKLLDAASRDRRVLDRLKVRHTDQWRVDEAHKDRLGMDEVALTRFTRNAEARATDETNTRSRVDDNAREITRNDGSTT
jgi:flagellar FliJ protein